jgi:predicted permease
MRYWHAFTTRLRSLVLRRQNEQDMAEELRLHIEREIEQHMAAGLSADEARTQALRAFGGVEQIKEACRDQRGTNTLDQLWRDLTYSTRRLARDWRFTTAAVLILGLGIGANTAMFSMVNAVLFRGHAGVDTSRLVNIYQNGRDTGQPAATSYPAYQDMSAYTDVFAAISAASMPFPIRYQDDGGVRQAVAASVTSSYLTVLGLRPSLGRWFSEAEDTQGVPIVAVLGHQSWTTRFGSDPSVVGRSLRVNGTEVTIVGVGPETHNSPLVAGLVTDFWLPLASNSALGGSPRSLLRSPDEVSFLVKARLREGVTVAQARSVMDGLGRRLAGEYPQEDPGKGISVLAAADVRIHPMADTFVAGGATLLLVIVGLVLAIACSNLATLLLVRGASRAKEVSVRLALGATRRQIVRYLMAENLVLAGAGGAAACIVAWWAINAIGALNLPLIVDLPIDYRVFGFTLVLSLATGMTFGLAPALKATRVDVLTTLKEEGDGPLLDHRTLSLKNALVVFQVAVSFVLLAGTGLFVRTLIDANSTRNMGYNVDGIAFLETDARFAGYDAVAASGVYDELLQRVAAIPGVETTVLTRGTPMATTGYALVINDADVGTNPETRLADAIWAAPGYLEAFEIPILFGRSFDRTDRKDTPRVAVINEHMAQRRFGTVNAVGRRFRFDKEPDSWIEVVGVSRDTRTADLTEPSLRSLFYLASAQSERPAATVVARTSLTAATLASAMQEQLRAIDSSLPVIEVRTMAQEIDSSLYITRMVTSLLAGLGALGLSLASIGLYAIVAFSVARRSREVGIRMALGARHQQVVWVVAREVALLVGVGAALGLGISMLGVLGLRAAIGPDVATNFFHPSIDPASLVSVAGLMALVAVIAAWVPARRAARMDPLVALRHI